MADGEAPEGVDLPGTVVEEIVRNAVARPALADSLRAALARLTDADVCDTASITAFGTDGRPESVAFSDDIALKADQLQYELDEGPCLEVLRTDQMSLVPDLTADCRWPRWTPSAAGLGIGASLSMHLVADTGARCAESLLVAPASLCKSRHRRRRSRCGTSLGRARLCPITEGVGAGHRFAPSDRTGPGHADGPVRADAGSGIRHAASLFPGSQPQDLGLGPGIHQHRTAPRAGPPVYPVTPGSVLQDLCPAFRQPQRASGRDEKHGAEDREQ